MGTQHQNKIKVSGKTAFSKISFPLFVVLPSHYFLTKKYMQNSFDSLSWHLTGLSLPVGSNSTCFQTDMNLLSVSQVDGCVLLLLLSRFSRVRLCATPQTAAHQAPPSLGFSRQDTGVGCHFLLQCVKVKSESEVTQSCPTHHDSMDYSLPGSSVRGIFQARVLEWGASAFSNGYVQGIFKN